MLELDSKKSVTDIWTDIPTLSPFIAGFSAHTGNLITFPGLSWNLFRCFQESIYTLHS